jgi:C-terminal processing protease CtpA/Prc
MSDPVANNQDEKSNSATSRSDNNGVESLPPPIVTNASSKEIGANNEIVSIITSDVSDNAAAGINNESGNKMPPQTNAKPNGPKIRSIQRPPPLVLDKVSNFYDANQKFWASLNENASRNKALANSRSLSTISTTNSAALLRDDNNLHSRSVIETDATQQPITDHHPPSNYQSNYQSLYDPYTSLAPSINVDSEITVYQLPPNATQLPPNPTHMPPNATHILPNATHIPPTATHIPPNATHIPPNATQMPPTATQLPPNATMHLPHWSDAIYELNNAILEQNSLAGGSENGQFIYIIKSGDIILELDNIKVSGFTLAEFNMLVESKQFHLLKAVQTNHSHGLSLSLREYLNLSFPEDSKDKHLQTVIRENIYRQTIPCTTRPPKPGEIDKVHYHFVTKEQFNELNERGMLLECGVYGGHYYGTLRPLCDCSEISHPNEYIDHNTQRTQFERPYEVELTKGSMGFGFTLVEADSGLLLVRSIIPGGPAHMNGSIRPGDMLLSAADVSVTGLQHTDIARLFSTFAVGDRVRLIFARSNYVVDDNLVPDEYLIGYLPPNQPSTPTDQFTLMQPMSHETPHDEYEYHSVDLERENTDSNWGIRLIGGAEVDRAISIGSMIFGGVASKSGKLKTGDEIISIDGVNVIGATHQHVVELISACSNRVSLIVRRKIFAEACDVVLTRNMDEGFGFVIISNQYCALIGKIIEGSPADRCKQLRVRDCIVAVNGRYITPDMKHSEIVNMVKECGSTLKLRIIPVDCYTVKLIKDVHNDSFGFRMRGGSEYDGTPLFIVRVEPNGQAHGLLNVGDQILEINNIPTVGMTHQQAATIIKYSDPIVKLKLRRNYVAPMVDTRFGWETAAQQASCATLN